MGKYIMSLDQGTTSSRCILIDKAGHMCSMSQKELTQIYPVPGWVEHDPVEIWSSQISTAAEAMAKAGASAEDIEAIGITNQRETTIVWDKETGKPLYNAIVWQCRRTADMIEKIKEDGFDKIIVEKTGLIPDAYFSATKIKWILDNTEGAYEAAKQGKLLFGTVDTWLIWKLTAGKVHVTDYTNASRTMLFDIHRLCWDDEILEYFKIPKEMLPKAMPSSCIYGKTSPGLLGNEIVISGAAGDQQAALFGQCCFEEGEAKNTYGTGCFLLMNTGNKPIKSSNGLLTTIAAGSSESKVSYALEGSVFVAGAGVQWLRDELGIVETAAETEQLAIEAGGTEGVYIVPAFAGLGAPYWNPYARGMITGITRGFNKKHLVRAVLESIAYQTSDVIKAMETDAGIQLRNLKVDGGAGANNFLMQFQSDILNTEVFRPKNIETTALGAAYLAGLATGYWKDTEEIRQNWELERVFAPQMNEAERENKIKGWKKAVDGVMYLGTKQ